jgi:RNA polymerase sigma-70 factor, ECF subfamily
MEPDAQRVSALMQRYAQGEDNVFDELYRLAAPRLYRFCVRLAARKTDADDLFQETFLKLHRARASYVAGADVLHWAFAIARAAHIDRLRYWRRRPEQLGSASDAGEQARLLVDDSGSPEAALLAHDLVQTVTLELSKMSERNRVAYVLLREEGLNVKDAAAVLGTTPDAVKQRAHRAYEQLRSALLRAGWMEEGDDATQKPVPIRN